MDGHHIPMDALFLPSFFDEDRAHVSHSSATDDYLGLWMLDEEDDSFHKALQALNNINDIVNDTTDNELDFSTSCASNDGLDESVTAASDSKRSMLTKALSPSELQAKMMTAMDNHISSIDISNSLKNVFDGVEHTSLQLETEMMTSKRMRLDSELNGLCLPVGKVPTNTTVKRCEEPGCLKFPQGSTRFCISHGGGRRCTFENCTKGARDRFFCAAHGGGRRCSFENCTKSAVGGSQMCATHGGGRKCNFEGCNKSAQSPTAFCVTHGGGRKCSKPGCTKVSRGKTAFCAAHGGGVRCGASGCGKAALSKSKFCRAHGTAAGNSNGPEITTTPSTVESSIPEV